MEIGRGFQVEMKMEIMVLKENHHPPIFLEAEHSRLIGLIVMETFGYLVVLSINCQLDVHSIHNIHICKLIF
jgi:hypothetical protein